MFIGKVLMWVDAARLLWTDHVFVRACVCACVKAVGLQRSGLDSSFPLRSLLWRGKKLEGRKGKKDEEKA